MKQKFKENIKTILKLIYGKSIKDANVNELYYGISKSAMNTLKREWGLEANGKKVCYFSAEFLLGRLFYNNLYNMGLYDEFTEIMSENDIDINVFEEIEDAALGNGGLGRLAACFLDSGSTLSINLNGYGIRYKFGLFKQYFEDGFQKEMADDWQQYGDPWGIRKEDEKIRIDFNDQSVYAVPYDYPVIGYGSQTINTLRLWQAEAIDEFDFNLFNECEYCDAVKEKNQAEAISSLLYPNDNDKEGKKLRLKQQYFFVSASLKDMLRRYKAKYKDDFNHFSCEYAVQLNDTHPVVAIPELLRLFMKAGLDFERAFAIIKETFAYTNHTLMAEASEKWDVDLFKSVIPEVYSYIEMINNALQNELNNFNKHGHEEQKSYYIIYDNIIDMARMAIFTCHSTNGVAWIHTEILKNDALSQWYELYPKRFNNKTNGITQRRWLALANMELSDFISDKIGDSWITNLEELNKLEKYTNDPAVLKEFDYIKQVKKKQLSDYVYKHEGVKVNPEFIFDIQIKRIHEYKRQLLNAFSIMDIYFALKDGRITDFNPTTFFFGGKAAPGYYNAKGIIKYINEIANLVNSDPEVNDKLQVVFVTNYNVSYAEKLIPAADVSEQISTAGTEASGTGNMKFMLNGAVTLGTYDGANVEIVEQAGEENNYIFGARVEDLDKIEGSYDPKAIFDNYPRIKRVVDTLLDGTFNDGNTGMFKALYDSLLEGSSWHAPDQYYLLLDFIPYCDAKLQVNKEFSNMEDFRRKTFFNTVNAGKFSSDRTIKDYANEIWNY